jgi:ribosomal subunit interface protein
MQIPLQVIFRNLTHSDAIEAEVRKRVAKLEQFCEHIISCRVAIETVGKHQHQGRLHNVHVALTVPGGEVVVTHNHSNEDIYLAIRDALDSAKRQLEDHVRLQRRHVKLHQPAAEGNAARLPEED